MNRVSSYRSSGAFQSEYGGGAHPNYSDSEKDDEELQDQVIFDKESDLSPTLIRSRGTTLGSGSEAKKYLLNEKACEVLKIPVDMRKQEDEDALVKAFKSNVFLKTSYTDANTYSDFILNCSRSFKYEIYHPGASVFHYGEMGDKFYIILKGTANIYVPKLIEDYETEFEKYTEMIITKFAKLQPNKATKYKEKLERVKNKLMEQTGESLEALARKVLNQNSRREKRKSSVEFLEYLQNLDIHNSAEIELLKADFRTSKLYIYEGFCRFKVVKKITSSDYFGELALSLSKPRAATVIAETALHLATLKKEDFAKIFDRQINELNKKVLCFQGQFPNCSKDALVKFSYEFKNQNFPHQRFLFKEGEPPNYIYLIKSGQVQLLKRKSITSRIPGLEENAMQIKFKDQNMIFIASLTEGQFLGEEDAFLGRPRSYSALAVQNVETFVIQTETLLSMKRTQADLVKVISERVQLKEKWRLERINSLKNVKEISNTQLAKINRIKTRKNRKLIGLRSMDQVFDVSLQQSAIINRTGNVPENEKSNLLVNQTEGSEHVNLNSERDSFPVLVSNFAIRGKLLENSEGIISDELGDDNMTYFGKAKITYEQIPAIVRRNKKFIIKASNGDGCGTVKFSNPFFNVPTLSNSLKKLKKELEQKKRKVIPPDWIGDNFQASSKDIIKMMQPITMKKNTPGYMTLKHPHSEISEAKIKDERFKSDGEEGPVTESDFKPQRARSVKNKIKKGMHSLKPSYFTDVSWNNTNQTESQNRELGSFKGVLQPEISKSEPRLTFISSKHNMFRIKPTKSFLMNQVYKSENRKSNNQELNDMLGGNLFSN